MAICPSMREFAKNLAAIALILSIFTVSQTATAVDETSMEVSGEESEKMEASGGDSSDWAFGKFRIKLGYVFRTKFKDETEFYNELYGPPTKHVNFGVDYYFLRKYFAAGIGVKMAYYVDQGHAVKLPEGVDVEDVKAGQLIVDENGKTELTLIPILISGNIQFSPFPVKYLTLDAWAGVEYLKYQEVRLVSQSSEEDPSASTAPITNSGTRKSIAFGGALNILLNGLDPSFVNSMRQTMGIGSVYLSPFYEKVIDTDSDSILNFDRTTMGISFTFESVR